VIPAATATVKLSHSTNSVIDQAKNVSVSKGVKIFSLTHNPAHSTQGEIRLERTNSSNSIASNLFPKIAVEYLSPRNLDKDKTTIVNRIIPSSSSITDFIDSFFYSEKRAYVSLSLKNLEEINSIYYSSLIQIKISNQKKLYLYQAKSIKNKMEATSNPLIRLILLNLQYCKERAKAVKKVERARYRKTFKVISALLEGDIKYFSLPESLSQALFLQKAFYSLDVRTKQLISYIIFNSHQEHLDNLCSLLGRCVEISQKKIAIDREKLEGQKTHQLSLYANYEFSVETIVRCYIPDNLFLPQCVLINNKPINFNALTGSRKEKFFNFFRYFFNTAPFTKDEETEVLLNLFFEENKLPFPIKNLLGISTVSMRLLAYECLDQHYPLLRGKEITYRPLSEVKIFYTINDQEISCTQQLNMTIYRKENPQSLESYAIDKEHPLANFSFILTSHLDKEGKTSDITLQFQNLEYTRFENRMNATKHEQHLIEQALNLKTTKLSDRLKYRLNALITKSSNS